MYTNNENERVQICERIKRNDRTKLLNMMKTSTRARVGVDSFYNTLNAFDMLLTLIDEYDTCDDDKRENIDDVFNECIARAREL